ncbi:MAG: type II toxin-antitoxin system RelE/ParE family toxin [Thermoanaerobaculia bacterium]|nr:type II toxin-antitoxin system RelE/ParE family toxin [Thermoanaerobaculia bacterium]
MGEVRWTAEAARWLTEIHDYIPADHPAAAQRTVRNIYERAQTLAAFPERGYRYEGPLDRHVRVVLYGHFRIAYLVKPAGDVDILGVFHGALDIRRYLE